MQDPLARSARQPYEPKPTINGWVIVGVIVGIKIIINNKNGNIAVKKLKAIALARVVSAPLKIPIT